MKIKLVLVAFIYYAVTLPAFAADPTLTLGSATARPGETVTIPITLATNGAAVVSPQVEVQYDTSVLTNPSAVLGPAGAGRNFPEPNYTYRPNVIRMSVYDTANTALPDGVLFLVSFTVAGNAGGGTSPVTFYTNPIYAADPGSNEVLVQGINGSVTVTAVTAPNPPTIGTATAGPGRATVTFTPPTSNGGSAITGYTVTSSPAGGTDSHAGTTLTTHTITGLSYGTAYTFTVTATNAFGTSQPSQPSNSVTPVGVPGAPTITSLTPGDGQTAVAFTAPSDNGSAITGYTVTSTPGGMTSMGTASPLIVTGLTNGVSYTFTVTATNAIGTGPASAPSTSVTPIGVPGAPTSVTATAGDGQATVSFVAPSSGGSLITGYTVTSSPNGFTATGAGSPLTVTGLANGTAYTFTVTATNAIGTGTASAASNAVTPNSAGLPTLTVSTLPNGSVTNNATLNVTGSVSSGNGVKSLTVNGNAVTVNTDGSFSTALTLVEGSNTITVVATDTVDRQSTDSRTVILDTTAPALTISAPADNANVKVTSLTITGTISDQNISTVTATVGASAPQTASITAGTFSVTVNLVENAWNNVIVVATDLAGNSTTAKRTIMCDPAAPQLSITDPAQDITIHTSSYLVKGTVSDNTAATVTITADGKSYNPSIAVDGSFQQQVAFGAEKTYAVVAVATDAAGNTTTVQRNIIYTLDKTGDVNGDHTVDIADALLALQIAIGNASATPAQLARGDVAPFVSGAPQPDGAIDAGDALVILEKVVNLISWQ